MAYSTALHDSLIGVWFYIPEADIDSRLSIVFNPLITNVLQKDMDVNGCCVVYVLVAR